MEELPALQEVTCRAQLGVRECLVACDRAFRLYGEGALVNPARREVLGPGEGAHRFHLEMHAEWPGRYRVRKVIEEVSDVASGALGQRRALLTLQDLARLRQVSMEAGHITDMRTGAAAALGLRYLAGQPVRRVALLGAGRVGRAAGPALDSLFELEEIRLVSRRDVSARAYAHQIGPRLRARLRLAAGLADAVRGVDAIVTAVPTPSPILSLARVGEACVSVVAGDPRTCQVEPEVLERLGVVVDHLEQARQSGDFLRAVEEGRCERVNLARAQDGRTLDMGDAACGRLPRGPQAPRLAYLTGLAALDLMVAVGLYEALCP
ncbi:MAG: hypothetical protein AB1505_08720 [Candidatus Latescibacterota bacterium]